MRAALFALTFAALSPCSAACQSTDTLRLRVAPVHDVLDVDVDYETSRLEGEAAITLRNWSQGPVEAVPLTLYRLMTIGALWARTGERLTCERHVVSFEDLGVIAEGPMQAFDLSGDATGAAGVLAAARGAFDLFTRWFGTLQGGDSLTFIEIPDGWGSQVEVTTCAMRGPTA